MYLLVLDTFKHLNFRQYALAGKAQWIECWPANQGVISLLPGQGMCLGCGPVHWLGMCERQPVDVSLTHRYFPLFHPPFPSL